MQRLGRHGVGITAALLLTACAGGPGIRPADADALASIHTIELRNTVWQDELQLAPPRQIHTGTIGQPLLDARIQDARWREIRRTVAPLYAAIDDVDVRARLAQALGQGVRQAMATERVHVTTTARLLESGELAALRASLASDAALLNVDTQYQLSLNGLRLEMTARVAMYRREGNAVYANHYYYQSDYKPQPVSGDMAAPSPWAENGGARYRHAIDEGVAELARMVALDLDRRATVPAGAAGAAARRATKELRNGDRKAEPVTGTVVQERDGRIILRADGGGLFSFAQ